MVNVFIDSNIYISILTNPGKIELFEDLKVLIKEKVVNLLVPEIIVLELIKQNRTAKHKFQQELLKLEKAIKSYSKSLWSEVRDIEQQISTLIDSEKKIKEGRWEENYSALVSFLTSSNTEYIDFTPGIMCKGEKRIISGNLARIHSSDNYQNSSQDAYIIESILSYLNSLEENCDMEFIFCTNDVKDFFKECKSTGKRYELNHVFKEDFKNATCFNTLENLMKYINYGYEYMDTNCIDSKEIDALNESISDDHDCFDDYEEYYEKFPDCMNLFIDRVKNSFNEKIKYTQKKLQEYRTLIIDDIHELLKKCREQKGWDYRSELKLYPWLENRDESYIEISKLSDLILIRDNMKEYLERHINMDKYKIEKHDSPSLILKETIEARKNIIK